MKKKIIFLGICLFMATGCFNRKDSLSKFVKKIENNKRYYLTGTMEIINNEDVYEYDVKVSYKSDDYYKVSLKNKVNDHEQIILKNDSGVYVKTQESTKQKLNVI